MEGANLSASPYQILAKQLQNTEKYSKTKVKGTTFTLKAISLHFQFVSHFFKFHPNYKVTLVQHPVG